MNLPSHCPFLVFSLFRALSQMHSWHASFPCSIIMWLIYLDLSFVGNEQNLWVKTSINHFEMINLLSSKMISLWNYQSWSAVEKLRIRFFLWEQERLPFSIILFVYERPFWCGRHTDSQHAVGTMPVKKFSRPYKMQQCKWFVLFSRLVNIKIF